MKNELKLKRMFLLLLVPIALILWIVTKNFPYIVEYAFARGYYKILGNVMAFISRIFPFSLAEALVCIAPFALIISIIIWIIHMVKNQGRRMFIFIKGIIDVLCIASVVGFLVITFPMININRYSFTSFCNLKVEKYSKEELVRLCTNLSKEAGKLRANLKEDKNHVASFNGDFKDMANAAKKAYKKISKEYPVLDNVILNPKEVHFSKYMSYSGIVGVYSPFTVEANVDTDVLEYKQPATICHELAHIQGFMLEDEANYIGYLVCVKSDNDFFKYSGVMSALSRALDQLYSIDEKAYKKIINSLTDKVITDVKANTKYWNDIYSSKTAKTIENATNSFNDSYLKISGQEGVKSYGLVVDLLLAQQRAEENKK